LVSDIKFGALVGFATPVLAALTGQLNPAMVPFVPFIMIGNITLAVIFGLCYKYIKVFGQYLGVIAGASLKTLLLVFSAKYLVTFFKLNIPKPIFTKLSTSMEVDCKVADGDRIHPGTILCSLKGPVKAILAGERVSLNFLQRLSGIATMTSKYVAAIANTSTRLLDTRKTTPMLRYPEKLAVLHGGGCNHRFGLFDMILIKDTHVKRAGGVGKALANALKYRKNDTSLKIEVEVQSITELEEALGYNPDRIMLDNMEIAEMKKSVEIVKKSGKKVELEASGNITMATITAVAETGVDFISCGSITHSVPSLDIH
jgi:nicotinate-nucleotide pyrophosphorylase (carboxylating)